MSTQGGGSVGGLGAACVALVGVGLFLCAKLLVKSTVLAVQGAVLVGQAMRDSYREHEQRMRARRERVATAKSHVAYAREALKVSDEGRTVLAAAATDVGSARHARVAERIASRRAAREIVVAEEIAREADAVLVEQDRLAEVRRHLAESSESAEELRKREADVTRRVAAVSGVRERIEGESRKLLIADAEGLLRDFPGAQALEERLARLKSEAASPLPACEGLLADIYEARRLAAGDTASSEIGEIGTRIVVARLAIESVGTIADSERGQWREALLHAEAGLMQGRVDVARTAVAGVENGVSVARGRDLSEWTRRKAASTAAVEEARAVLSALEEDEGILGLVHDLGKREELESIRRAFDAAEGLYLAGEFEPAGLMADRQARAAAALRDSVLDALKTEQTQGIAHVIRDVMVGRGFADVIESAQSEGFLLTGTKGPQRTPFMVMVDEKGGIHFDLGKEGFASQHACDLEIEGFLRALGERGVKLDLARQVPLLEPTAGVRGDSTSKEAEAAEKEKKRQEAERRRIAGREGQRN